MSNIPAASSASSWDEGSPGPMTSLELARSDWQLILELLEAERSQISPEIHHTDTPRVHDALVLRKQKLEELRNRVRSAVAGSS